MHDRSASAPRTFVASKTLIRALASVAALLVGSAAMAQPAAPAGIENNLTIYSSLPAQTGEQIFKNFEKAYPQVKLNILQLTSGPLFSRFAGETESGVHQADVFVSGSAVLYQKSPELFERLTKDEIAEAAKIPPYVAAQNEHYLNVAVGPFQGSYNTSMVSKQVLQEHFASWKDVATPFWRDKIVTVDQCPYPYK